jgi:hypothetical protein
MVFGALLFLATLKIAAQETPAASQAQLCLRTVALGMAGKQAPACPPVPAFSEMTDALPDRH